MNTRQQIRDEYPDLTKDEIDHIRQLRRRCTHLRDRIANYKGRSDSYDRAELAALTWALDEINNYLNGDD
jgi:hypothetical protein